MHTSKKGQKSVAEKDNNSPKTAAKRGAFKLEIVANYEQAFPTFYSNIATVSHTPAELCIDFCLLAPPHNVDVDKKTSKVPVIARMLVPEDMARGLVKALQAQLEKYEKTKETKMIAVEKRDR
jgi:hypothetical protein